jgi:tetratricopeptide (TPR) repeat protein
VEGVNEMKPFDLPEAPGEQTGAVKAWQESVTIPTYPPHRPDKNPMFLEKRVYQGSSGRVYPLHFIDRIETEPRDNTWQTLHIENEYIRLMILPELGGRIHVGLDKTNNYNFFYRQNVIKPALVGLAGPWASGGVEFNWPQHHRPATFMPVETVIERHADGSQTIWCSDHEPMNRMKGMHGVCVHPGRAYVEVKVRLYNRTPFVQTFLWWANVATQVHELYQSFFPPDVRYVADHARRSMSAFPLCEGSYYGVDYSERARSGVPPEERPAHFVPDGSYPANDLSWYANIPVPTSYMALGCQQDFSGGYDHKQQAGVVYVANHHIAPGKKQWTWGNQEFGYVWDRNLTDSDGPYIELMAGAYTDNQPDFSFLAPGETKTFSQYWYPIQQIGPAQGANLDGAISLQIREGKARAGVSVTRHVPNATVCLKHGGETLGTITADLAPGRPLVQEWSLPASVVPSELQIEVQAEGRQLISYCRAPPAEPAAPEAATEPPLPDEIFSADELFVTGLHLDQYRHATRQPEIYWQEALRRDPGDARSNNALGLWHLRRGEFLKSEGHFRRAITRLTRRNANPYDGEPYYNLGLTLRFQERFEEAYAAFYKSTWNSAWRAPGYLALAEDDARREEWVKALEHVEMSLRHDSQQGNALCLRVIALRRLGREQEAEKALGDALALDPLNAWARALAGRAIAGGNQLLLDVAIDYRRCGLHADALRVLRTAELNVEDGSVPIVLYELADLSDRTGDRSRARSYRHQAARATPDYCLPSRLEELVLLEAATQAGEDDARAPFYLGNLLYDRRRHAEAIDHWERSAELNASFATVWRNLGIAYFNAREDTAHAQEAFEQAWACDPTDARILYERDQLWKRAGVPTEKRLAELTSYADMVNRRDDLSVELATLFNQTGRHEEAAAVLTARKFQPWEGGEGLALGQHVRTQLGLGRKALKAGNPATALSHFEAALDAPENLGEAKHLLVNQSHIHYWCGVTAMAKGDSHGANGWWARAAEARGDFQQMTARTISEMTYYSAMALWRLGRDQEASERFKEILEYSAILSQQTPKIDYFATSLPAMLLFTEDLGRSSRIQALFLEAQARLGLGQTAQAHHKLDEVLSLDPSHAAAFDLMDEMDCEAS